MSRSDLQQAVALEQSAVEAVVSFARANKERLQYIAHWGDGRGGYIANLIASELGLLPEEVEVKANKSRRPEVGKTKRNKVFDLHGNQCLACKSYDDICIDHVVPLSAGGLNHVENMQPLCRSCNSVKGVKTIDYRPSRRTA